MYPLLPTPGQLARATVDGLNRRKFSRRKAEYIIDLADVFLKGKMIQGWSQWANDLFIQRMCALRGIGLWTTECVLLLVLARSDVFPAGDIGLQKAVQAVEDRETRPGPDECRTWVAPYSAWSGYMAIYLWGFLGE
jgi:DNA-3-methyladenine glycosylase II